MSDARSAAQQAARDEYRRLLYVAMTRAKERLVIAGTQGRNKIPDGCWYQLVDDALREATASASRPTTATARCCASAKVRRQRQRPRTSAPAETAPPAVPDWLRANASSDHRRRAHRDAVERRGGRSPPASLRRRAPRRCCAARSPTGCCSRCRISPPRGDRQAAEELSRPSRAGIAAKMCAENRRRSGCSARRIRASAELFAPGSRAEVPIVGRLVLGGETIRVSGQVDRLAVTQGVCADCRFQDQPAGAAPNRGRAARLRPPARALPRRAAQSCTRKNPCAPL